jgi:LmbE family N-acetylglucosaminyl deacetylase
MMRGRMRRPTFLDSVFERTATRFLRRIHRITHRMPVRPRAIVKQRVLVIAPHPDDEVIAVGGSLALHQRAGSEMMTLYATMDEPAPDGSTVRRGEAERAARLLGFDPRFLGLPDGALSQHEATLTREIEQVIRSFRPEVIYCPFPADHHRDHMSASACTGAAVTRAGYSGDVCCYEVWTSLWPNAGVDITSVIDVKREAINCYASQVASLHYVEGALGLNRFRGLKLEVPYAEAFFACEPGTFHELCRTLAVI